MELLIIEQQEIKNKLDKTYSNLKKTPKSRQSRGYWETRLENVEGYWVKFDRQHSQIVKNVTAKERSSMSYFIEEIYDQTEELFLDIKTYVKDKCEELEVKHLTAETPKQEDLGEVRTKLPPINIPKFSGDYKGWTTFHDLFVSLIHQNTRLSDIQKHHYLKTSLVGEAEQLLRNFTLTDANYTKAFDLLKKRYSNKRRIVHSHLTRLLSLKKINTENARHIKELLDTTTECLSALDNLDVPTEAWDAIIVHITVAKLDGESHKLWEQLLGSSQELPTFQQLTEFLETRFRTMEMINPSIARDIPSTTHTKSFNTNIEAICTYCSQSHYISHCKEFPKQTIDQRRDFVKQNKLCFNCLVKGHMIRDCRQSSSCKKCGKKHHTLLHSSQTISNSTTKNVDTTNMNAMNAQLTGGQVVLATALVTVNSSDGGTHVLRELIDQGSQASFLSESACQLLGLRKTPILGRITGIDPTTVTTTRSIVDLEINSRINPSYTLRIKAYVLKRLTSFLPSQEFHNNDWSYLSNYELADPTFYKPGKIDLLLGAEEYAEILLEGLQRNGSNTLIAQNSQLGWLLSGKIPGTSIVTHNLHLMHSRLEIDQLLRQFWEIEETKQPKTVNKEEIHCQEFYEKTHERTKNGRYVVRLPFHTTQLTFGDSRNIAIERLRQMERRFKRNPTFKEDYTQFLREYEGLGHMEEISTRYSPLRNIHYLPHHAVVKEASATTKLRVVFDGSAKASNGLSLNDHLLTGPALQQNITELILRWRTHKIGLIADIKQMYRQILVNPNDTDCQRIVWRESPDSQIKDYRLLTITYGTSCAPYLAIRTLQQLANDERNDYPLAAEALLTEFYMDDLLSGASTKEEAEKLQKQLCTLLKKGGFELHKWASSNPTVLENIPDTHKQQSTAVTIKMDNSIKALGIRWNPMTDNFEIKIDFNSNHDKFTKRTILSEIATIFDPLGWLAPTVIVAKIFIQKLWSAGLDWDTDLPHHLQSDWIDYRRELIEMADITLERWIGNCGVSGNIELHGFSDASCVAYSAVVYIRVVTEDGIKVSILAAKTRVAPVKQVSLPRLELCGAVLLTRLLTTIISTLNVNKDCVYAWTDSTIVLAWLRKSPNQWKTFVANRVSEILAELNSNQWHHIRSSENPADCASRGLGPDALRRHQLWWNGPRFLHETGSVSFTNIEIFETDLESKLAINVTNLYVDVDEMTAYFKRFSDLPKLVRVTAYCMRFINKCKHKVNYRKDNTIKAMHMSEYLTVQELDDALMVCLELSQTIHFGTELQQLRKGLAISRSSHLKSLNPTIDSSNLLKVGGRLHNALLDDNEKHPIILAYDCPLSTLLVRDAHKKTLHGGQQLVLNAIRKRYWIIRAKNIVKKVVGKCITCFRLTAQPTQQLMGNLPKSRVMPSRPFIVSGVDFAGPIGLKLNKGRSPKLCKGYISLFICQSTKAIHLELVSDLTSRAFIAAFQRFTARRGHCRELWSDQGTNFVGASKELDKMLKNSIANLPNEISEMLANDGTKWHFIPAGSPHFGGLWEAGVKSVKYHLKRVVGDSHLTFEEYNTLLTQIEACLNSRPLTKISSSIDMSTPLTPGHFLIGESFITVPDVDFTMSPINRLDRWQLIQRMLQGFWKRWSSEYLVTLQHRYKWDTLSSEIAVGSIVLVKDDRLPPGKWLLGRILKKHAGNDGLTRVVTIKCKNTTMKRPITKICVLPIDE